VAIVQSNIEFDECDEAAMTDSRFLSINLDWTIFKVDICIPDIGNDEAVSIKASSAGERRQRLWG